MASMENAACPSLGRIAGDGNPWSEACPRGPFEPPISGCLTGDLGVPSYEPDGISWLPHPAAWQRHGRRLTVRIGPCRINLSRGSQKNFRNRARPSRLPFSLMRPVAYALNGPISRGMGEGRVSGSVGVV